MAQLNKLVLHGKTYTVAGTGGGSTIFNPDWDSLESRTWGTSYTAEKAGYVIVSIAAYNTRAYLTVNSITFNVGGYDDNDGHGDSVCVPVSVGDTYHTSGSYDGLSLYGFIPVKGQKGYDSYATGKPDWSARVGITGNTDYICPKTGYVYYNPTGDNIYTTSVSQDGIGTLLINGKPVITSTFLSGSDSSHVDSGFFAVGKGDVVRHTFTVGNVSFLPMKITSVSGDVSLDVTDFITRTDPTINGSTIVTQATLPAGYTVDQTYDSTSANAQSGTAVAQAIQNVVGNYMKNIDTTAGTSTNITPSLSFTAPKNGWVIIHASAGTSANVGGVNVIVYSGSSMGFPILQGTVISAPQGSIASYNMYIVFFPEQA